MLHRYQTWNGPMPTTAAQAALTTGTAIETHLQIATPATRMALILGWGYSLSVAPGAASTVELLQTDVAATVTAHGATGVQPLDPGLPASLMTLGTSATGYNASAEGSITATRVFDARQVPLAAGATDLAYEKSWDWWEAPIVGVSKFLRVRTTVAGSASNFLCWVKFCE